MTDYSELVGNPIVARVIQSDEEAFEEAVAKAVRSSDNLDLAASKVENYVTDVIWDVLYGLEDYEPIAYSLAYEGKLSLDYEGYGDDLYNVVKAYVDEGPTLKRFRPRAKGSASRINKRSSHITVVVAPRKEA